MVWVYSNLVDARISLFLSPPKPGLIKFELYYRDPEKKPKKVKRSSIGFIETQKEAQKG